MTKPRVIISAPVPADLRAAIEEKFDVVDIPAGKNPADELDKAELEQIEGILCTVRTKFDDAIIASMPRLSVISNFAVGFDNVNVEAATGRRVLVCNTPKVLDGAVADLTFGLMLCLTRDMVKGDAYVRNGTWAAKGAPALTHDIRGKTLGLLGMGRIGRVVARTAKAFDMKVIYHNRRKCAESEREGLAEYCDRDTLFTQADFLSVHIPLNNETRSSVGKKEFEAMKQSAYLINTARGAVIDEDALIHALESGQIAGAGLDVMVQEPLPPTSRLCELPNVVLQAHVGSGTFETRRAMIELASKNLLNALSSVRPEAMVNPEVWDAKAETADA